MNEKFERLSRFRTDITHAITTAAAREQIRRDQVWALALSWLVQLGEQTYGTERVVDALRGVADELDSECRCPKCRQ